MNLFDMFDNFDIKKEEEVKQESHIEKSLEENISEPKVESSSINAGPSEESKEEISENNVTASSEKEFNFEEALKDLGKAEDTTDQLESVKKIVPKKPQENTFKVTPNTVIRYFGEVSPITDFFSLSEINTGIERTKETKAITAEDVRKRLEKVYPELTKRDSIINYIEKKDIIVPSMMAKKKGAQVEPMSNIGSLLLKQKIPYEILVCFVSMSKLFEEGNKEVHADVYYNFDKKQYFLDIPKQVISTYNVEVVEDSLVTLERVGFNSAKVLEIHSHHSMRPIPSAQDNASERVTGMYYAIVGGLEFDWPEIFIRTFIGNDTWLRVHFNEVFETPFTKLPINFKKNFQDTFLLGDN